MCIRDRYYRWTSGVVAANTPTSIALDVDVLTNGYYRVFVANSQGVLSAPAFNKVTISISRASDVVATTTTVAVRRQTLDQSYPTWHIGNENMGIVSFQSVGQLFRAGLTGPLSRISVGVIQQGAVTTITASIYAANTSGNATGSVLASETIDARETPLPTAFGSSLTDFDFDSPASVTAGVRYVIVMTTPDDPRSGGGEYSWVLENGNSYAEGNGIVNPTSSPSLSNDLMFRTYVDI